MARQHRESLVGGHWKGNGVSLTPVNRRINRACDGEHRRGNINADNPRLGSETLTGDPSHDPGTTRNVDNGIATIEPDTRNELFCEWPEQRSDQNTLVDLGKRRRHEERCL
jgi:hypothetical protein